jgi:ABC-type multidrug transport system fused ATPase/permease subunit
VGPTGSGKSTIANLLVRLYTPSSGAVLLNNTDFTKFDLYNWRSKIGYVSQDVYLFNASLRDNITLWHEDISEEDLTEAVRLAQLEEFILSLPDGYATAVGDRGLNLSGGQCQRIALARAILRKPEILILDEATSSLDTLTEQAVYEAIHKLRREAIVVIIAHRLNTIREAGQIVVLDGGRIVEIGNHESLIERNGMYSALYFLATD